MPFLVDGHNLIPKMPGLSLSDMDDEQQLQEWLQVFCQVQRTSLEVFFDGAPAGFAGTRGRGRLKMHFVRQGYTADAAIIDRLARLGKAARNWTVVSSDRRVQAEARGRRAAVISSEEFAARLVEARQQRENQSPQEASPLGQEEVEEWLRLFGEDGKKTLK